MNKVVEKRKLQLKRVWIKNVVNKAGYSVEEAEKLYNKIYVKR